MAKFTQNMTTKHFDDPRFIFLLDGSGGIVTFCMYQFVLPQFETIFFLPHEIMQKFSIFGILYAIFSLSCWKFAGPKPFRFLGVIAFANLLFCGISLNILIQQFQQLSLIDVLYLVGEKFIILSLVYLELRLFIRNRRLQP